MEYPVFLYVGTYLSLSVCCLSKASWPSRSLHNSFISATSAKKKKIENIDKFCLHFQIQIQFEIESPLHKAEMNLTAVC